jgi:hypothetical protein
MHPIVALMRPGTQLLSLGQHLHTLVADGLSHDASPGAATESADASAAPSVGAQDASQHTPTDTKTVRALALWREVDQVVVSPTLDEASNVRVLQLLQGRGRSKLLDLRPATVLTVEWFERLAAEWRVPAAAVPRLALVLDFERWALWESTIVRALRRVADHGVQVRVFYAEQVHQLDTWFVDGKAEPNLSGVLGWVRYEWPTLRADGRSPAVAPPRLERPWLVSDSCEESWAIVLRRTAMLVEDHATVDQVPWLRLEFSDIARTFGGPSSSTEALHHLSAALYWLGDAPSQLKCRVLRAQAAVKADREGATGVPREDVADALRRLDEAALIALNIHDPLEAVHALIDGGRYALRWGLYARAERRIRRALELATDEHPAELRADVRHLLARVLLEHGKVDEAAMNYAKAALWLRADLNGRAADDDRDLLAAISARLASPPDLRDSTIGLLRLGPDPRRM